MKAVQRGVMKVLPGKMPEAMGLMMKHLEIVQRLGMSPSKMGSYRYAIGDEILHTLIFEYEWDSLTEMSDFFERMMQDREMQDLIAKWQSFLESHLVEVLSPIEWRQP